MACVICHTLVTRAPFPFANWLHTLCIDIDFLYPFVYTSHTS